MTDQQATSYRAILTALAVLVAFWGMLGLIDYPNVPFSGVHYQDGNIVSFIYAGSPAEQVGIHVGDRVLSVNGAAVHGRRDIDRMPRPRVGETQTFVVDRDGEQISFEVIQAGQPKLPALFSIIGISFLCSGLWAYRKVPTPRTLLLCLAGIGLGMTISAGPYLPSFVPRMVAGSLSTSLPILGLACFLLFLLTFPEPKALARKKVVLLLMFGPPVVLAVADLASALIGSEATAGLESLIRLLNGILVMLYLVLGLSAAAHSYFKASRPQRSEQGLNIMLSGLALGILPIVIIDLVVLALGIEFGGAQYAFTALALVPIALAVAAVKMETARPRET